MKTFALCAAFLLLSTQAIAAKPCEALKSEIAAQLDAKKVQAYTLSIVAKDAVGEDKVVGSCDGGTHRITYKKDKK